MIKRISLLALLLSGCSQSLPSLTLTVENGHVDLAQQVTGDWDSVCILTPYTTDTKAALITGLNVADIAGSGIASSDSFQVLVFLKDQTLHSQYQVNFSDARFDLTTPWCFEKEQSYLVAQ